MCLGQPCTVLEVQAPERALVRGQGPATWVSLLTLDGPLAPGEWVLVHCGFALARLSPVAARDALRLRGLAPPKEP